MASEIIDSSPYPWQQEQWARLLNQRSQDCLPHALLLVGQTGLGLDYFAHLLGRSLLCSDSNDNLEPCGECPSCRQIRQQVHPDHQTISLLEDKKSILVDQIRELNKFFALTSGENSRKVVVISPADQMNINASNSLLKTLEEPAGNATIILVGHHLHRLPATVKSRCQMIKFSMPERAISLEWLAERGHDRSEQLLQLAQGAPCLAEVMDNADLYASYVSVIEGALASQRGNKTIHQLRTEWKSCEIHLLVEWSQSLLRDCIRVANRLPDDSFENPLYLNHLREMSNQLHLLQLFRVYDHLVQLNDSLDHSLNADLLLDDVLLAWLSLKAN